MSKTQTDAFVQWLCDQQPEYDRLIIQDIRPSTKCLCPLPVDVRLLPNRLRPIRAAHGPARRAAKRLQMSVHHFRSEREIADRMMRERLKEWLAQLPKRRRKMERALRLSGWIGHIETGTLLGEFGIEKSSDRFHAVYPNVSQHWR